MKSLSSKFKALVLSAAVIVPGCMQLASAEPVNLSPALKEQVKLCNFVAIKTAQLYGAADAGIRMTRMREILKSTNDDDLGLLIDVYDKHSRKVPMSSVQGDAFEGCLTKGFEGYRNALTLEASQKLKNMRQVSTIKY